MISEDPSFIFKIWYRKSKHGLVRQSWVKPTAKTLSNLYPSSHLTPFTCIVKAAQESHMHEYWHYCAYGTIFPKLFLCDGDPPCCNPHHSSDGPTHQPVVEWWGPCQICKRDPWTETIILVSVSQHGRVVSDGAFPVDVGWWESKLHYEGICIIKYSWSTQFRAPLKPRASSATLGAKTKVRGLASSFELPFLLGSFMHGRVYHFKIQFYCLKSVVVLSASSSNTGSWLDDY